MGDGAATSATYVRLMQLRTRQEQAGRVVRSSSGAEMMVGGSDSLVSHFATMRRPPLHERPRIKPKPPPRLTSRTFFFPFPHPSFFP